jgi:hypothetical protein
MKKTISIIGAVIIIGLVVWGAWSFVSSKGSAGNTLSNSSSLLPSVSLSIQSQTQNGASVPVQGIASPQNSEVAKDLLGEMQNANQIALGGTVVASPYALQIWGDANEGGEALLEYSSSTGWNLISLGGGEWNVVALIQEGVPQSVAKQLIAGLTSGMPSPAASSTIIPAGDTIILGTAQGSVAMNNFYKNAGYIAQDQQTVVIQQASTYSIVYDVSDSSFTLTISSAPLDAVRQAAEAAFLSSLGISQQDACKLRVYEDISGGVPNQYAGKSFPLSFCAQEPF